ncbi:MAG: hypothetical protein ACT4OW_00375 [Nitrososphaerota archaeon]
MASKVVSTKLSIEEHGKFLEICRIQNCTPSTLIKNLILNLITSLEKNENLSYQKQSEKTTLNDQKKSLSLKNESQTPQFENNDLAINELIKKIDNAEVNIEDLNQLYLKLGDKFEKTGLSKSEELLYRKTHQKLKEKLQYNPIVQNVQQSKPHEEKKTVDKNMSAEERFQYF